MSYLSRKSSLLLLLTLAGVAAWSCSPPARDGVMHFFFEIPSELAAVDQAVSAPPIAFPPPLAARRVAASIHPPFAQRQCLRCHVAENANQPPTPVSSLCRQCHAPVFAPRRFAHGPFVAGACMQCHAPHLSSLPRLLRAAAGGLCMRCHEMTKFPKCSGRRLHPPGGCVACHEPHGADQRFLLKPREKWSALLPEAAASQPAEGRP